MSKIWAITSYFNPAGYRRRLENYHQFRRRLSVPLATAEVSHTGEFALNDADADRLLRFRSNQTIWQKERLLNLIVADLPQACEYVAWIDCDVIFESNDWANLAMAELQQSELIHLYDNRVNLPKEVSVEKSLERDAKSWDCWSTPSAIALMKQGQATDEDFQNADVPLGSRSTVGLAWACCRRTLKHCGLYDACIVGGADRAILGAALGRFEIGVHALKMKGPREAHYRAWASRFYEVVQGRVGHISGRAFHLWHGDLADRRYVRRLDLLNEYAFDPYRDIALDHQGLWKWDTDKPELQRGIQDYFASRKEDGG